VGEASACMASSQAAVTSPVSISCCRDGIAAPVAASGLASGAPRRKLCYPGGGPPAVSIPCRAAKNRARPVANWPGPVYALDARVLALQPAINGPRKGILLGGHPSTSGIGTARGRKGASLGSQWRSFSSVPLVRSLRGRRTTISPPSRYSALSVPEGATGSIGRPAHGGNRAASSRRTRKTSMSTSSACVFAGDERSSADSQVNVVLASV